MHTDDIPYGGFRRRFAGFYLAFLFLATPHGLAAAAPEGAKTGKFGFNLSAGIEQSLWTINQRNQCENCTQDAVNYETEGLSLYRLDGNVTLWGASLLNLHVERPFNPSQKQRDILLVNDTREASSEKYSLGIAADALAERYFPDRKLVPMILKRLASIKVKHSRELFWGQAKAAENLTFLPLGAAVDYAGGSLPGGVPVSAGDAFSFRTVFSGEEVSLALHKFSLPKFHIANAVLRAGYFNTRWERLADARIGQLSAVPILYEAEFRAEGFLFKLEALDPAAPGFNADVNMKWGVNNHLNSAFDWQTLYGEDVVVQATMVEFGGWYNFYLNKKDTSRGLALTAGGMLDMRGVKVEKAPGAFSSQATVGENADLIFKYFATASYRW